MKKRKKQHLSKKGYKRIVKGEIKKAVEKEEKREDRSGLFLSLLLCGLGIAFLLHGFRYRYLNTFIFGFVCLLISLHHYLRIMFRKAFEKTD